MKEEDQQEPAVIVDDYFQPPPNHTKGKWVPGSKITKIDYKQPDPAALAKDEEDGGKKKNKNQVFWCNTCNRKLASRILYVRHLKSNLHVKRSLPENELGRLMPSTSANLIDRDSGENAAANTRLRRQRIDKPDNQIYSIKPSISAEQSGESRKSAKQAVGDIKGNGAKLNKRGKGRRVKRIRRRIYTRCEVCKVKLPISVLGKHLISHFHYRRLHLSPEKSNAMVLENFRRILQQSPYQCQPCKFYANTQVLFMKHWTSLDHQNTVSMEAIERMWCSFCKFKCSTEEMLTHLHSDDHQEVVLAFNRSVPIIVRQLIVLKCPECHHEFHSNFKIRRHKCQPELPSPQEVVPPFQDTSSDAYQCRFSCHQCDFVCRTKAALTRHLDDVHQIKHYYCTACDLVFSTMEQVIKHRRTEDHKVKVKQKSSVTVPALKTCMYCHQRFVDIQSLKGHLAKEHPEMAIKLVSEMNNFQLINSKLFSKVRLVLKPE